MRTKLAALRVERGISQKELARAAGVSERTVQRIESGEHHNPPIRHLVNIAIALNVSLTAVLEDEWTEWLPTPLRAERPRRNWFKFRLSPEEWKTLERQQSRRAGTS